MVVCHALRQMPFPAVLCALIAACGSDGGPPDGNQNPPPGGGTPAGDVVTQQIGPAGGTISTSDGGMALVFPAGALAAATEITIRPAVNTAPTGIGVSYRIEPSPLPVTAPVELRIAVDSAALGNSFPEGVGIGVRNAAGDWFGDVSTTGQLAPASAVGGGLVALQDGRVVSVTRVEGLDEWVEYSLIAFWVVKPFQPIIVSRGASVQLSIEACLREDETDGSDEFLPALPGARGGGVCQPSIREGTWFVNGVRGGNQSLGFVAAGTPTSSAEFVAPSAVPSPNPVTVTASMYWRARNLTAPPFQIPIAVRSGNLAGNASGTVSSGLAAVGALYSFDASVTWVPETGQGDAGIVIYRPTGTVMARALNRCISGLHPETFPIDPSMGTLTINWEDGTWTGSGIASPPGGFFRYYDTCASMDAFLEISAVPFMTMIEESRPLPVQGALEFPPGAGIVLSGTFSFQ